jgi:hypothetical protein
MQKKIISIAKLQSNNPVRVSKEGVAVSQQSAPPSSQANSATNQSQKVINLSSMAHQLQNGHK